MFAKFNCEFWLRKVEFLGHVMYGDIIMVYPKKMEAVKIWSKLLCSWDIAF